MSGISGGAKPLTCKHLLKGAPDCVFCHRDQLRQELSLAEEGLANYAQENAQLRAALQTYGSHGISCPKAGLFPPAEGVGFVCTCGFEAITAVPQSAEHGS